MGTEYKTDSIKEYKLVEAGALNIPYPQSAYVTIYHKSIGSAFDTGIYAKYNI